MAEQADLPGGGNVLLRVRDLLRNRGFGGIVVHLLPVRGGLLGRRRAPSVEAGYPLRRRPLQQLLLFFASRFVIDQLVSRVADYTRRLHLPHALLALWWYTTMFFTVTMHFFGTDEFIDYDYFYVHLC